MAADEARARGERVLVHCVQGISRSATVVIAYLMYVNPDWSLEHTVQYVKARRSIVNPHTGFLSKLTAFALSDRRPSSSGGGVRTCTLVSRCIDESVAASVGAGTAVADMIDTCVTSQLVSSDTLICSIDAATPTPSHHDDHMLCLTGSLDAPADNAKN